MQQLTRVCFAAITHHRAACAPIHSPAPQVVKVYVSVYSDDYGKRVAILNLQRLEP